MKTFSTGTIRPLSASWLTASDSCPLSSTSAMSFKTNWSATSPSVMSTSRLDPSSTHKGACYLFLISSNKQNSKESLTLSRSYDWTCEDGMGGGVLTMIGTHVIDVVSAVIRQRAVRVHGVTRTGSTGPVKGIRRITSDRFANFVMEMNGGALVAVTLNSQEGLQQYDISFSVTGSQGYVSYRSDPSGEAYFDKSMKLSSKQKRNGMGLAVLIGGTVTGRSMVKPSTEIFHTDTDELSFLPSSIVNNAPIQPHQRPYINGLFRMVRNSLQTSKVMQKSNWIL